MARLAHLPTARPHGLRWQHGIDVVQPLPGREGSYWSSWPLSAFTRYRWHRAPAERKESTITVANALTLLRLVATIAFLTVAIWSRSSVLLVAGLSGSWLFDTLDGYVARARACETVFGAQLDAAVDRVTVLLALIGSVVLAGGRAEVIVAATTVWLQYGVVDQVLFAQFLRFHLWTPDEFHTVDKRVWLVSWSQLAKGVSGTSTAAMALGGIAIYCAAALSAALIAMRVVCYLRIARLSSPADLAAPAVRLPVG